MATANATILPNSTFTGGTARHIGQMYFEQAIISDVEATAPYNTNTQTLTTNLEDMLAPDQATAEYDPFLNYVMLGDKIEDGLLMWITIGVNTSADYSANVSPAAHYLEGGGVSSGSGGGGSQGGPDGFPGGQGGPPNGTVSPPPFGNGTGAGGPAGTGLIVEGTAAATDVTSTLAAGASTATAAGEAESASGSAVASVVTAGAARRAEVGWMRW